MRAKIVQLDKSLPVPHHKRQGDAGIDLYAAENVTIKPGKRAIIPTGIKVALPLGYVALIWDRSGLAAKQGLTNLAGVIDSTYRGEYKIVVLNTGEEEANIQKGDRIAQMLIQKHETVEFEVVEDLEDSVRGEGGFGSSGK